MKIWTRLKAWWNRPPARIRILAVLSDTEWQRSLTIIEAANISIPGFYHEIEKLEQMMLVESRIDIGASRLRRAPTQYRRLPAGTALLRVKK